MGKSLVIVESPAKAKNFFPESCVVRAKGQHFAESCRAERAS